MAVSRILPGHHQLAIPIDITARIAEAFEMLDEQGKLKQGEGVFSFDDFQIHL